MEKKRSVGVTIFGWLGIIAGSLATILLLSVFIWDHIVGGGLVGGLYLMATGILFLLFFPFLFLGIGLLKLKPLARIISVIDISLILLLVWAGTGYSIFYGAEFLGPLAVLISLLLVPLIIFLTHPKVMEQFKQVVGNNIREKGPTPF